MENATTKQAAAEEKTKQEDEAGAGAGQSPG
jgi:hypothetical protein